MIVEEKDLVGQLVGFPVQIVQRMVDLQFKQTGKHDVSVFQRDKTASLGVGGFDWCDTPKGEGYHFWEKVIRNKDFNFYFQKYPSITEDDITRCIEGMLVRIVQRMCEHQVNQGNAYDVTVFQRHRNAPFNSVITSDDPGFDWDETPEGHEFWESVIEEGQTEKFDNLPKFPIAPTRSIDTEQKAEDPAPYQNCAPDPLQFPRLMHVSDWEDMRRSRIRVVEKTDGEVYWAWQDAGTMDSPRKQLTSWKYAREIGDLPTETAAPTDEVVEAAAIEEPNELVFPMVMEVSDDENFQEAYTRVVVFKNRKGYFVLGCIENFVLIDSIVDAYFWPYARIPKKQPKIIIEMTHEQIAKKLGIDPALLKITP